MTGLDPFTPPPHPDERAGEYAPSPLDPPPPFAPPARRRHRRWIALAVVAGLAAVGIVAGVAWDLTSRARDAAVEPAERGDTGTFNGVQVVAGMCMTAPLPAEPTLGKVAVVACEEPHRAEAIAAYAYPETAWPGSERVSREATDFCAVQVGRAVAMSDVDVTWEIWAPSQDTWGVGDRTALCVVSGEEDLVGSFESGDVAPAGAVES